MNRRAVFCLSVLGLALCSVSLGFLAGSRYLLFIPALVAFIAALVLGIHNWRWAVYGLLLYLPFSGILIVLTYPKTAAAVLVKDFLFVIPAYVGFLLMAKRRGWTFPGTAIPFFLGAFALLVVVQSFNPQLKTPLVPLIGIKVWLLYIPLLFLGYQLVETKTDLTRVLWLMTLVAVVPATIGIVEALLLYSGQAGAVYSRYGEAAAASTQNFFREQYAGGGSLVRIPSTFSFVFQYFLFTASMVAVTYAWWRLSHRRFGVLIWALVLFGAFTSGARGAFIMVPLLVLLIALLEGRAARAIGSGLLVGAGLLAALLVLGADPATVLSHAVETGITDVRAALAVGEGQALPLTTFGSGTGSATGAAGRYAFSDQLDVQTGPIAESWWVKVVFEEGLPGLLIILSLFGWILARTCLANWRFKDPGLRACSAALLSFLIWNLLYLVKGFYIDLDPINVYFWLFAGILLRLPSLEPTREAKSVEQVVQPSAPFGGLARSREAPPEAVPNPS